MSAVSVETRNERLLKLAAGLDGLPTIREAQKLEGLPVTPKGLGVLSIQLPRGKALSMVDIKRDGPDRKAAGCGTIGCMAGHGVGILGIPYSGAAMSDVGGALGLDHDIDTAEELFAPGSVPYEKWPEIDGAMSAKVLRHLVSECGGKDGLTPFDVRAAWLAVTPTRWHS
ncbi:MAG: hypothetical protein OXE96_16250 [Gemmatimonadetes bacterium]|nr:hypothetical protein [Gemmatimonadota bacterium]